MAIQSINRSEVAVPRSGKSAQRCACAAVFNISRTALLGALPANSGGKKVRINFADLIDVGFDFHGLEACAGKGTVPLICSQETGIGANFGISIHLGKTFQDLKHQFGVDGLIRIRAYAFTNYQPAAAIQCAIASAPSLYRSA